MKKSLYIAVILYESSSDSPSYKPLYQECFTLIKTTSLERAKEMALNHARKEKCSFKNEQGELITWSLKEIVDVNNVLIILCPEPPQPMGYLRHRCDFFVRLSGIPIKRVGVQT